MSRLKSNFAIDFSFSTRLSFDTDQPLETMFFSGRTTSLVSQRMVSLILDRLRVKYGFSEGVEISIEMGLDDKES
ncbi:unnamed protein product [Dovyalis caffra]|uniref:Uncharacterized protein n=1 Tax=Dovyalis caffra TaxID=77055 RepID=A0AAV1RHE5_9ROSI|nr:unnamed protein product [Dovyalis caffra]